MPGAEPNRGLFVRLAEGVSLRRLEEPCLYDRRADELYELNQDGLEALARCRGHLTLAEVGLDPEFEAFCLAEGLLSLSPEPRPMPLVLGPSPRPSLRYLELQITWRCNLACGHCYLGPAQGVDLPLAQVAAVLREFEAMGGLRVLISGGEPLMHPQWEAINAYLATSSLRRVLLTNGLLLDEAKAGSLAVDEVQVSLDGMAEGHQALRGPGSFEPAVAAARAVRRAGLDLSVATMVHAANLDQFDQMQELVRELQAQEWGIDAPCPAGRLGDNAGLTVGPARAAEAMAHAYGGAYHGGGGGMACGLHLATVAADGRVAKCGFYLDSPLGTLDQGLWTCWARQRPTPLSEIAGCAECPVAAECGGGCRFRAPAPGLPDPVMCSLMGVTPVID